MLRVARLLAWLSCAGLIGSAQEHFRLDAQARFAASQRYEDIYYLPPDDYLVLGSLGHRAALADLIWMKALVYYGEELGQRGDVKHLFRYADAMLALDPDFKRVYRWVASSAIYRTGNVTAADAYAAIRYLETATRRFPDDGELAWDLGANYMYELPPLLDDEQARAAAKQKGYDYLETAVLRNAGPPWLVLQTAGQLEKLGRTEQAIKHLEDVYATASSETVKQSIELQLARLRSAAYAEAFGRANAEFEARRKRDFPYLDATLYLLVGARPPRDWRQFMLDGFDPVRQFQGGEAQLSD